MWLRQLPPKHLEKDIESVFCQENIGKMWLKHLPSFDLHTKVETQVRMGKAGRCDVLGYRTFNSRDRKLDNFLNITIYEIKKGPINIKAIDQLQRYVDWMEEYYRYSKWETVIMGVLIGSDVKKIDIKYANDEFSFYKYHNNEMGFYFEQVA